METKQLPTYIPDSSEAEKWLSWDVFLFKGERFNFQEGKAGIRVIKMPKNGKEPTVED